MIFRPIHSVPATRLSYEADGVSRAPRGVALRSYGNKLRSAGGSAIGLRCFLCVLSFCLISANAYAGDEQSARVKRPYLLRLAERVTLWQNQLPDMDSSAMRAADGAIAGGNLYAFGPQSGFISEVVSRAGGLMLARPYVGDAALSANDTILAAILGSEDKADLEALRRVLVAADKAGSQVVLFGATGGATANGFHVVTLPRAPQEFVEDRDIASASNVAGMWAWTGRFIAACTRRGAMPCVYQSHLLPEGRQRTEHLQRYDDGRFHLAPAIEPNDAAGIADAYLRAIEQSLRQIAATQRAELEHAALLLRAARDRGSTVAVHTLSHIFPGEFRQPQQPAWLVHIEALQPAATVDTALVLYHASFPWKVVDKISNANQACIVVCAQPALGDFTAQSRNVYINPYWPIHDAIVELRNYDVPVLPASGVLNAAIYWQLVEQAMGGPNLAENDDE